jgi:GNAT superfamily N-acetyltransferase
MRTLADATIRAIDAFWSSQTSCDSADFDADDIVVVARPSSDGSDYAQVLRRKQRLQITCSASLFDLLRDATEGQSGDVVFDPGFLRQSLGSHVERIVGPAFLGYLDTVSSSPVDPGVRLLPLGDAGALEDLRRGVSLQDWEYSGLAPAQPTVVCFDAGRAVSAAGYEVWAHRIAHIGVVTRLEARANGYGRKCVHAIAEYAIAQGLIAQYRTLYDNAGAMALARQLGFSEYGATIYVEAHRQPN